MRTRQRNSFLSVRSEGALLPADLLERLAAGDREIKGLAPADYHLAERERLAEAANRAWNACRAAWATFNRLREELPPGDAGTGLTRERWLLPLFAELGYGRLLPVRGGLAAGEKSYPISHAWHRSPIHLVGYGVKLDDRTPGVAGAAKSSPHSLVQEFLNRSDDHLWGFVSNGQWLRILRDNASLTRQAYVEFDLQAMMDGELYADFVLLWLLCHQSRVEAERPADCWLERWTQVGQQEGTRLRDRLRDGVEAAIGHLGSGFLAHPANEPLRRRLRDGELDKQEYYRQLLRLVYRLLFLFVAEDRGLLLDPHAALEARQRYTAYYSSVRLRTLAGRRVGTAHHDLYQGLRLVIDALGSDAGCPPLALPALGGFLFSSEACSALKGCGIGNMDLLAAVRALAYTEEGKVRVPVDYRNLGSEELGSIYEALLELHPELHLEALLERQAGGFTLRRATGNERKSTGSYYTNAGLISSLLDTALDPVLDEAARKAEPEAAILALTVCDPACGSGHFLIAAANRIAKRLAGVCTGDEEPAPEALRSARRAVIGRCIYGVDMNPMAVELCKVSLWLEALDPGKPLSFLDGHIQCGNSLLGATPALLDSGIPDAAFTPIDGDDKAYCTEWRKRNAQERKGQQRIRFDAAAPWDRLGNLASMVAGLEDLDDTSIAGIHAKEARYAEMVASAGYRLGRLRADAWCAAFVWPKRPEVHDPQTEHTRRLDYPITESIYRAIERNPYDVAPWMVEEIARLACQDSYNFLHWQLAFPTVFRLSPPGQRPDNPQTGWNGGFDVVIGNPPWDQLQLEEVKWFATRDPDIAKLDGDKRKRAMAALFKQLPQIGLDFAHDKHMIDVQAHFVRDSERFPLTATGKLNTYALFAETFRTLLSSRGRAGVIVPTNIATDDSTKAFFGSLTSSGSLVSIEGFENEAFIFPGVHHAYKFCLLTIAGPRAAQSQATLCFLCRHVEQARDPQRRFTLSPDDFHLLNPNTRTCPVFRTRADADLARAIYRRVPVLMTDTEDHWGVTFRQGLFNMTSDSKLFKDAPNADLVPLYEAKLLHQFDHRWATYDGAEARDLTAAEKADPHCSVTPRYWVPRAEVEAQLAGRWDRGWLLGFRDIARNTDERTAIFSLLPRVGVGHKAPLIMPNRELAQELACLLANTNTLVFDYCARTKVGGTSLSYFILKQLPVLPPSAYGAADREHIVPRVLELAYTAWDMRPFADDLGYAGPPFPFDREVPDPFSPTPGATVSRRALVRAELDAYYARLYRLTRKQLRYILDPLSLTDRELANILDPAEDPPDAPRTKDFPGETFRVLKDRELRQGGEYRTARLVLGAFDAASQNALRIQDEQRTGR